HRCRHRIRASRSHLSRIRTGRLDGIAPASWDRPRAHDRAPAGGAAPRPDLGGERAWGRQPVPFHGAARGPGRLSATDVIADGPHVLVVEDNELVTGALRLLLESVGYHVSTAASISGALGVSRADPPALTLLDLTLPDGDGLSLVAPLHSAGCKTVVALTG